jgi:hypothetical protein
VTVVPFARDDVTHTTGRVLHIALATWDQMHVAVKNGLSCGFAIVRANVESSNASIRLLYRSSLLL